MGETVSFKVFLQNQDQREVRRFDMKRTVSSSFSSLKERLVEMFPQLGDVKYSIAWADSDGDMVAVDSDEELAIALTEMPPPVYKLVVKIKCQEKTRSGMEVTFEDSSLTPGVSLDQAVDGSRSPCMMCQDVREEETPVGHQEVVFPKKLLKRIQKIHGKSSKQNFDPKNLMFGANFTQPGATHPPYFGFPGPGRGMFRGSIRGAFRGRQGLEALYGGFAGVGV